MPAPPQQMTLGSFGFVRGGDTGGSDDAVHTPKRTHTDKVKRVRASERSPLMSEKREFLLSLPKERFHELLVGTHIMKLFDDGERYRGEVTEILPEGELLQDNGQVARGIHLHVHYEADGEEEDISLEEYVSLVVKADVKRIRDAELVKGRMDERTQRTKRPRRTSTSPPSLRRTQPRDVETPEKQKDDKAVDDSILLSTGGRPRRGASRAALQRIRESVLDSDENASDDENGGDDNTTVVARSGARSAKRNRKRKLYNVIDDDDDDDDDDDEYAEDSGEENDGDDDDDDDDNDDDALEEEDSDVLKENEEIKVKEEQDDEEEEDDKVFQEVKTVASLRWKAGASLVKTKKKDKASTKTGAINGQKDHAKIGNKPAFPILDVSTSPLVDPYDMFADIVRRIPKVKDLAETLGGHSVRVATMCSGTEAPILALNLMSRACEAAHGLKLNIEHVFSCEIDSYKQAYIERNFRPPILFRDVTELGGVTARTAYGSVKEVPTDVDILIAGTSCVDFSNLNTKKNKLEDNGESGRTWRGMMAWIERAKPAVIICENVCGAPWIIMKESMRERGYVTQSTSVDTKHFYIPQTRNRGYLVAFREDIDVASRGGSLAQQWVDTVHAMAHAFDSKTSSTVEAFLFDSDDPRVMAAREELSKPKQRFKDVDWTKCESRNQKVRLDEGLGLKKPFTNWEDGGLCKLPDYAWQDWASPQVPRVLDVIDINYLLVAHKNDEDAAYKMRVWDLSQNSDRQNLNVKTGLCSCLTPSGEPFVTYRGGVLTGQECLRMQGIPVDDLIFTRETEAELKNLAGNAMSTTVVGTCSLVALILAMKHVGLGASKAKKSAVCPPNTETKAMIAANDAQACEQHAGTATSALKAPVIRGFECLAKSELKFGSVSTDSLPKVLTLAERSARRCTSEGPQSLISEIVQCKDCGHTVSKRFAGHPEHNYAPLQYERVSVTSFVNDTLLPFIPMVVKLQDLKDISSLEKPDDIQLSLWKKWSEQIRLAHDSEYRFRSLHRGSTWEATYTSAVGSYVLTLELTKTCAKWTLDANRSSASAATDLLDTRLARLITRPGAQTLFDGVWEVCLPRKFRFNIDLTFHGDQRESWCARLGLIDKKDEKVWTSVTVTVPPKAAARLDLDISGEYKWLEKCGGACGSLHKRISPVTNDNYRHSHTTRNLFFFLDPDKIGPAHDDSFVFATSYSRLRMDEMRDIFVRLDENFRIKGSVQRVTVGATAIGSWIPTRARLEEVLHPAFTKRLDAAHRLSLAAVDCRTAEAVAEVQVHFKNPEKVWFGETGRKVALHEAVALDLQRNRKALEPLSWLTSRIALQDGLRQWKDVDATELCAFEPPDRMKAYSPCPECAPVLPSVIWETTVSRGKTKGAKAMKPVEDPVEASAYERALKQRPATFTVQLKHDAKQDMGSLSIGVNVNSLLFRAAANFPRLLLGRMPKRTPFENSKVSWRVVKHSYEASGPMKPYTLLSNRSDKETVEPSSFLYKLRPEQRRSLTWMLRQEADTRPWLEEEVEESIIPTLQWRAEGRVEMPIEVSGGVLADDVGYGKTAITLALIECASQRVSSLQPMRRGVIPARGTLVVLPSHLMKQWHNEVAKFLGPKKKKKVIVIEDMRHFHNVTIKDIQEAEIVLVSITLFKTTSSSAETYFNQLADFACWERLPKKSGRMWESCYLNCVDSLSAHVDELLDKGAACVRDTIISNANIPRDNIEVTRRVKGVCDVSPSKTPQKKTPKKMKKGSTGKVNTGDPWELRSARVQRDYREMQSPPFEMFAFERLVVDEYTYLEDRSSEKVVVQNVKAKHRWVLSGTPNLSSFEEVRLISRFLGINLGRDELMRQYRDDSKTGNECLLSYAEPLSASWHERRHGKAQDFLDRFVRQNIAEIDEIPTTFDARRVKMSAPECALYLELRHFISSFDSMTMKPNNNSKDKNGDREVRMAKVLDKSSSPDEALVKRCSFFNFNTNDVRGGAENLCMQVIRTRQDELNGCRIDLKRELARAEAIRKSLAKTDSKYTTPQYSQWLRAVDAIEDGEAKDIVTNIISELDINRAKLCSTNAKYDLKKVLEEIGEVKRKGKEKEESSASIKAKFSDKNHELRELVSKSLRKLDKELCARVRSLRYFHAVRDFQSSTNAGGTGQCAGDATSAACAVFSACGHRACSSSITRAIEQGSCIAQGCRALIKKEDVVYADRFRQERNQATSTSTIGQFGTKMAALVGVLQSIPADERMIIFVQYPDLLQDVARVLSSAGIPHSRIDGSGKRKSNALVDFQNCEASAGRALLLLMGAADASGANLCNANHAIFVHRFMARTSEEYKANRTQAIGRVRRYGQTKRVTVYDFLCEETVESEGSPHEHREKEK